MAYVTHYRDLQVYKISRQLSVKVFQLSKAFPKEEMYSLTDQIRRSSRSVGAQIAEAWGKRPYIKHFVSKLTDADGEQLETQHWIETAKDCRYLSEMDAKELLTQCESIGRMISSMMGKADQFCIKAKLQTDSPLPNTEH